MKVFCKYCRQECEIRYIDLSFDHAFGTEKGEDFVSECCEGGILDEHGSLIPYNQLREEFLDRYTDLNPEEGE